jgi:hypothetical protein
MKILGRDQDKGTKVKSEQHSFKPAVKICHWQYCTKCGLVALRNEATAQAMKLGCDWYEILYPRKIKGAQ